MATLKILSEQIANRAGRLEDYVFQNDVRKSALSLRAKLLRQEKTNNGRVTDSSLITLSCISLKVVDMTECCDVESGCNILRTVDTIPSLIGLKASGSPFDRVGNINLTKNYGYITTAEIQFYKWNRFTGGNTKYAFINGYIYIFNNLKLEKISVTGVFYDPTTIQKYCSSQEGEDSEALGVCFDVDGKFNLEPHLEYDIKLNLYREYGLQVDEEKDRIEQVEIDE